MSDGVCNNLNSNHSKHWGATGIPMRRFSATAYECNNIQINTLLTISYLAVGTAAPRGGFNPSSLPSTRDISTALHKSIMPEDTTLTSKGLTLMTMQFAQFLDHDITLTPEQGKLSSGICFLIFFLFKNLTAAMKIFLLGMKIQMRRDLMYEDVSISLSMKQCLEIPLAIPSPDLMPSVWTATPGSR